MRIVVFFMISIMALVMFLDESFVRRLTSEMVANSVNVKTKEISPLTIETQELVNDASINKYAIKALSLIFNFRPGQSNTHIEKQEIKDMFVSDEFYEKFAKQFVAWGEAEFFVNNISVKESVASDYSLVKGNNMGGGARVWVLRASLPMLNRAVGENELMILTVKARIVYLGPEGGLGLYGVDVY